MYYHCVWALLLLLSTLVSCRCFFFLLLFLLSPRHPFLPTYIPRLPAMVFFSPTLIPSHPRSLGVVDPEETMEAFVAIAVVVAQASWDGDSRPSWEADAAVVPVPVPHAGDGCAGTGDAAAAGVPRKPCPDGTTTGRSTVRVQCQFPSQIHHRLLWLRPPPNSFPFCAALLSSSYR